MDLYRACLRIEIAILKHEGIADWEQRLAKDLKVWDNRKSVAHHLKHFGGMGSLDDVVIADDSPQGIWRREVFGMTKAVSWSLATNIQYPKIPFELDVLVSGRTILAKHEAWSCFECGHQLVTGRQVDRMLAKHFVPRKFAAGVAEGSLAALTDFEALVQSVSIHRASILSQLNLKGIAFEEVGRVHHKPCPVCGSTRNGMSHIPIQID